MVARLLTGLCVLLVSCSPLSRRQPEAPSLVLEKHTWEFGTLKRGETSGTEIAISNGGGDTLRISVYSTCECLSAELEAEAIGPGETKMLVISYMGDEVKARVTKTVFLDSNDPLHPRLTLSATGTILPGELPHLFVTPNPLPFDVAGGDGTSLLRIANRGKQILKVGAVRCYGCESRLSLLELAAGEEIELDIGLLPDWHDQRWIEIESNDPVSPMRKIAIVELD